MSDRTRIDRLVESALGRPSGERQAFLDAACDGDGALRGEVESLLAQASSARSFLEKPAHSFLEEPAASPSLMGRSLGPYRIDARIGAGGMGEVYRARDTRLGRDVAIKILPAFMAQDPDRVARLGREARALAALNHPHIGAIYGLEEADGVRGLVLELVDGETLADRIAAGPLPIDEALRVASQIAEALAVAHAKGIVHRDLKPANVKITTSGVVKVLDFGLAKAEADESEARTLATRAGTVMGTPAYMSPEQARGEAVDQQTDIWAFGCVLYEMLTTRRAFGGRTASDAIAAVLTVEPDVSAVPAATPAAVRTLLARCLAKDRARRLHSIADARIDLESALTSSTPAASTFTAPPPPHTTQWPAWWKWSLAAALGLAIGVAAYAYGRSGAVETATARYSVDLNLPDGTIPWTGLAISPDGKALATSVGANPRAVGVQMVVRYFDQLNGWRSVNGGDGGEYPFWSPDSKHLAFFADGKLLRVDPVNGAPVVVCAVPHGRGGVWLEDGTIVFADISGPLMRVDAQGGSPPRVFVPLEEGQQSLRFPVVAGQGQLLYLAAYADTSRSELRVINIDAPQRPTAVMKATKSGVYERGYLFYDRDGVIIGQRFDPSTNRLQGEPLRVTSDALPPAGHAGYLALAAAGGHVAVATVPQTLSQLVWMTREGEPLGNLGSAMSQQTPDLSPDGKRLAIARRLTGQSDSNIWIVNTQSAASQRLTTGYADYKPVWAPDGQRLAFSSVSGLRHNLYTLDVEDSTTLTALFEREAPVNAFGWTANGRIVWSAVLAIVSDPERLGIFVSPGGAGSREPTATFRIGNRITDGRLSPDGTYIAYTSSKTGQNEAAVYVDTFPTPAANPMQVSKAGGQYPRWRGDGRELYFVAGDELMAVNVLPGSTTTFGLPARLFKLPAVAPQYAVDSDGSKFLVLVPRSSPSSSLRLTLNWFSSLAASKDSP